MKVKTTSQNIIHSPKQTIMNTKTLQRKLWLCFIAVLFALMGKAQIDTTGVNAKNWACGIDSTFWKLANLNPDISNARYVFDTTLLSSASNTVIPSASYTIPVVFHVISTSTLTSVLSYAQIKWQLAALNAAYQDQLVAFRGGSVGSYTNNTKIQFVLACNAEPANGTGYYNPVTGQPCGWTNTNEPGVVRYDVSASTYSNSILNQGVLDASTYTPMLAITNPTVSSVTFFPKTDYLNIYCVPNIVAAGGGMVIGFATFPWMSLPLDGITFRIDCIGNNSYPTNFPMFTQLDKGVILAHEAGHYLGLYHPFETISPTTSAGGSPGCYGMTGTYTNTASDAWTYGDLIYDTPPTQVTSDLGNLLVINSCTENYQSYIGYGNGAYNQNDQLENIMCYSDDDKLNTLTQLQARRMWGTLDPAYSSSSVATRQYLVSSTNLNYRGVNTCNALTGIVSGVFNYSLAIGSTCSNVIIQFTNPATADFNSPPTTTYSWTFGDGGTSTSISPTHTYTTQNSFTVTCTATNGTITNTYSTTVTTNFNVHIVGQSSQPAGSIGCYTCSPTTTSATVCRGSEQTIFVWFDTHVSSAILTDGTNIYPVINYMDLSHPEIIPYLITATNTASYSVSPASCYSVSNGSATFNVVDCCPSVLLNGDFESTYTTSPTYGFNTDLYNGVLSSGYGTYTVSPLSSGGWLGSLYGAMQNLTGKMMIIDCFEGNNTIVNIPPSTNANPSPAPRIWQETVTGLLPNTPYFLSFKMMENYYNDTHGLLVFQASVASNTITALPVQTFTPTVDNYSSPLKVDWVVYTYTFTTPPATTTGTTFSVTINQTSDFWGEYYDTFLDNITLNQMTPGLQAIGTSTICFSGSTQLNTLVNCANPANYSYVWLPNTGLSCNTCTNPIASPTTTTVYTLTAVPTSTLGTQPSYVSTVTVTVLPSTSTTPTLSIAGTTTLCPGTSSTTLTASGAAAGSYQWFPGGSTSNPAVFTPTVTTTYTLNGEPSGCKNMGTQTITVVVSSTPTTILVTPSSPTVCSSNTAVTLSASGATTYTWYPVSSIAGSSTSSSISASPVTNTIFTVTGTYNGCVGTNTASVSVISAPVLTFSATPSFTICTGQTATVTAGGASTYYWSPSGATTNSIVVTPTVTTTYALTGSSGSSCSTSNVVTVYVNTYPTMTITATPTVICVGTQVHLTAGTASTYSWSPASSLNSTTNYAVIGTPYSSTTYTVVGANGSCTTTQTIAISVQTNSCTGTQPVSYNLTGTNTYTTTPTLVNSYSNLLVNTGANITFSNQEIRIAPGSTITVAPSATLTISNCWLHACASCATSMWQGIVVENGGVLNVSGSIIEDALQAVYTAPNTTTTPIPAYTIHNCILNNNIYGIYINTHQGNLGSNDVSFTVFTNRSLSSHSPSSINTMRTDIASSTPLHPSASNILDSPLGGANQAGVYITAVNIANQVNVGDKAQKFNIFDNLRYGIYSYESGLTAQNNHFQNLIGNNTSGIISGVGIFSDASKRFVGAIQAKLIVGNPSTTIDNTEQNVFTNCLIGVYTNRMSASYINNNIFNNETTATTFTGVPTYTATGQFGTYQNSFNYIGVTENYQFANNNVQNYATGSFLDFAKVYNTASGAYTISSNTITATTSTLSTTYCNTGLYLQQSYNYGAVSTATTNAISITTNSITNVNTNAISVNAVTTGTNTTAFMTINANTELSVKYSTAGTATLTPPIAAVYLAGCNYVKVSNNSLIGCTALTGSYSPSNAQYIAGIYNYQSTNSRITCNSVTNVGECFVWNSTNSNAFWVENKMHNSRYGLVLRNTGVMGNQGGSGHGHCAIYEEYGISSTDITSSQTLADNSFPGTTPTSIINDLATTCGGSYTRLPCTNTVSIAGGVAYASGTTLITNTNTASYDVCTSEGGTGRMQAPGTAAGFGNSSVTDSSGIPSDSSLVASLDDSHPLPIYDYETHWATQHYVNKMRSYISATPAYANAKTFAQIDNAIIDENYSLAQSLNNGVTPTNVIESNWQGVTKSIINMQGGSLSPSDVNILQSVASQCPLTGGSIVWKARALLNSYYKTILDYPNACDAASGSVSGRVANLSSTNNFDNSQSINVYPNPNNGKMTFEYSVKEDTHLEISDLNGKLVGTYYLAGTGSQIEIKNDDLKSGMYFYRAIGSNSGSVIKVGKIIIMQ